MKRISAVLVTFAALMVAWASAPVRVLIDGDPVVFDRQQPLMRNGRVMVPLRGVFEKLGAVVHYTSRTRLVRMTKDNESIELRVGERMANKNGAEIEMDVAPILTNGRTLVPLRFLAESLRADVSWNGDTNTVEITTGG